MSIRIGYLLPTRERIMAEQPQAAPLLELAERAERVSVPLRCPSWRASPSARRRVAAAKSRPADAAACRRRVAAAGDSERHSLHGRRSAIDEVAPLGYGYAVTEEGRFMPLTNAEKQRRWRQRHADRRRTVARIATMLVRQHLTSDQIKELAWS